MKTNFTFKITPLCMHVTKTNRPHVALFDFPSAQFAIVYVVSYYVNL